ncbi:MAG: ABC transporter substrate-binding protein [Methylobacteriaceae bacterium]|jgi:taurine transport system substrate-binding protein|nr:ABC transporter substrate-binding protein [Methylobacteriaceae bacterium]
MRKSFAVIAASLFTCLAFQPVPATAQQLPEEVRFAWAGAPRIWVLAKEDGSFEKALGVRVKWVQFGSGADVLTLFAGKEIDIARFGSNPAISGYVQGLPIELISVPELIATSEQLAVKAEIKELKDLEGKTIAFPPNSTAQYALEALLDKGLLDRSKVKLVGLKPAEIIAAWKRGDIDGAYAWDPAKAEITSSGGHVIFSTKDLKPDGILIYNNYVVSKEFASAYPDLVAKFLKVHEEKVAQYKKDPEAAVKTIAKYLDQSEDSVRGTLAGLEYPSIAELLSKDYLGDGSDPDNTGIALAEKKTAEFLVKAGQLQAEKVPAGFGAFNNPAYLKEAQK